MAYPYRPDPYNMHGTDPQIPMNAAYGGQYVQYQTPQPPSNDRYYLNGAAYHGNVIIDPRQAQINGIQQHRQETYPTSIPQKAVAVSIPIPQTVANPVYSYVGESNITKSAPPAKYPVVPSYNSNGHLVNASTPKSLLSVPPLDYQILLLSMAEEYFAAAYGCGSMASIVQREKEMQEYYKLIATGLGCLEVVMKHFKLQPEREATIRLRYATVLYEETENIMEAEEALSKGISICDRHRFFDLKYNMQHLLARTLFRNNSRAAFKFIDGVINDVEAYQHVAWVYAFRFLKVSLHLELATHQDLLVALTQLKNIINLSNQHRDKSILATATTLEALICLKVSSDTEYIEQAQRALASVRSLQLDPTVGRMHQLTVLAAFADLCCHLQHFEPTQAMAKLQVMQMALKTVDESQAWTFDSAFAIPFSNSSMPSCNSRNGIIRQQDDGSLILMFSWSPKEDIYTVGYLLSGVAMAHRNSTDGQKAEHMLEEGIRRLESANRDASRIAKSIVIQSSQHSWRENIMCYMRLHLAFILCARTSWSAAKIQQSHISEVITSMSHVPDSVLLLRAYLEGVVYQGNGMLSKAVQTFSCERLSIDQYRKTMHPSTLHLNVALLSALSTLMMISNPKHPLHHTASALVTRIEHLCLRNPDRQIQAAYHLVAATTSSASTILQLKQSLQSALQSAKQSDNKQIMCMVLNFMSWKFFRGNVGEQAEKSAKASQTLAQKCMDGLWMSVSAGVLGDTLEAAGRIEEAKRARESGAVTATALPEELQDAMRRSRDHEGLGTDDDMRRR